MRVFISYSLGPVDQHIAQLLSQQAQTRGLTVDSTKHGTTWTDTLSQTIGAADVVVAIVSNDSQRAATVRDEVQTAANLNKPVIALVERGTAFFAPNVGLMYVEFDRYDPSHALFRIGQILEEHRNKQNLQGWIVAGGLAMLALYLLSGDDKQ